MDNNEKYEWAKYNTSIINDLQDEFDKEYAEFQETGKSVPGGIIGIPDKFDPLNANADENYARRSASRARCRLIVRCRCSRSARSSSAPEWCR